MFTAGTQFIGSLTISRRSRDWRKVLFLNPTSSPGKPSSVAQKTPLSYVVYSVMINPQLKIAMRPGRRRFRGQTDLCMLSRVSVPLMAVHDQGIHSHPTIPYPLSK